MSPDTAEVPMILTPAEGVFVRQEVDNMAWVDLGGLAVVVDALEQPQAADEVFDAIAGSLGRTPIRYVLNTHTHYDHVALNGALRDRYGAEIVNAGNTSFPPEGRWFDGRTHRLQMLHVGGCHTDEDCLVWIPDARVLFVGDLFGWGLIPLSQPLRPQAVEKLLSTYERMIGFEADVVTPGHGPLCSTAELRRWVAYFRWLMRTAAAGVQAGRSDEYLRKELAVPHDMEGWWRFADWKHEDSVSKVLHAARKGWLTEQ